MTITLLLDIDDTLLINPMDTFIPAYLGALSNHLKDHADPQQLIQQLLFATSEMSKNLRPDCTLKEIFDSIFYPALGWDEGELRPLIDQFYTEQFPNLKPLTKPRPGAIQLVEEALKRDYQLAIATNPLFPKTAIVQRLDWAGLSPEDYPFEIIPSYETFHYAKPHPAFLAELLAELGWPDQPGIMIGDNVEHDIPTALDLGIPMYWTPVDGHDQIASISVVNGQGDVSKFFDWLDRVDPRELEPDYDNPSAVLAILRSTPAAIDSFCRSLDADAWTHRPQADEWSLTEILCHLRDVDTEVNLPRLHEVLSGTNPFITGIDTDPWAIERNYLSQDGLQALRAFTNTRMKILDLLERLQPSEWRLPARHTILGPTNLQELVRIISSHDRLHIQQITSLFEMTPAGSPAHTKAHI